MKQPVLGQGTRCGRFFALESDLACVWESRCGGLDDQMESHRESLQVALHRVYRVSCVVQYCRVDVFTFTSHATISFLYVLDLQSLTLSSPTTALWAIVRKVIVERVSEWRRVRNRYRKKKETWPYLLLLDDATAVSVVSSPPLSCNHCPSSAMRSRITSKAVSINSPTNNLANPEEAIDISSVTTYFLGIQSVKISFTYEGWSVIVIDHKSTPQGTMTLQTTYLGSCQMRSYKEFKSCQLLFTHFIQMWLDEFRSFFDSGFFGMLCRTDYIRQKGGIGTQFWRSCHSCSISFFTSSTTATTRCHVSNDIQKKIVQTGRPKVENKVW